MPEVFSAKPERCRVAQIDVQCPRVVVRDIAIRVLVVLYAPPPSLPRGLEVIERKRRRKPSRNWSDKRVGEPEQPQRCARCLFLLCCLGSACGGWVDEKRGCDCKVLWGGNVDRP